MARFVRERNSLIMQTAKQSGCLFLFLLVLLILFSLRIFPPVARNKTIGFGFQFFVFEYIATSQSKNTKQEWKDATSWHIMGSV